MTKDQSIVDLLAALSAALGPGAFDVVDHWEADLVAVGIGSPENHDVLAYLSTHEKSAGRYLVHLELPSSPGSELPHTPAGEHDDVSFEMLVGLLRHHFEQASTAGCAPAPHP